MKAYCINLDRRPDRLHYITGEFARVGVPFTRIAAVDAQKPAVAALAAQCPPTSGGPRMSAGAYGCFQSHRIFWRLVVESGEAYGMIFEDDLVLAEGIGSYLSDDWVPVDADLVKLETLETRAHLDADAGIVAGERRLHRLRSSMLGTGCYVVSAQAAARLLVLTETFREPVDQFLFNEKLPDFPRMTIYQMVPAPVIQGDRAALSTPQDWIATSITDRFSADSMAKPRAREKSIDRLRRRVTEEMRGRIQGTRYAFVPHG